MQKQLKRSRSLLNDLVGFWRASLLGPPILGFMALSLLAQPVGAQQLVFLFDEALYDAQKPVNQPPGWLPGGDYWLKAIISEVDEGVQISLQANLDDTTGSFIESVAFNLDPFVESTDLQCSSPVICGEIDGPSPNPGPTQWGYNFNENGVNLPNGANGFDFEIILPNSNKANRLTGDEEFNITVGGLSVDDFNTTNCDDCKPGSRPGLYSAAKIQGYGGSATLVGSPDPDPGPTPVPGPLPIVGAAAAFQASRRLRSRLKSAAVAARPA